MKANKQHVNYKDIELAIRGLATKVKDRADVIIGVPRGGLIPATMLSHRTNLPLIVVNKDELYKIQEIAKTQRVAVVDDVNDTGETFKQIAESGTDNLLFVSVFKDPDSTFDSEFVFTTRGKWIVFPWETK